MIDDGTLADAVTETQVDRRKALKAALGGAAAAAVLSGPAVSGLGTLPAYAQASSPPTGCTPASDNDSKLGEPCGPTCPSLNYSLCCWGSTTPDPCVCGSALFGTITVPGGYSVDLTVTGRLRTLSGTGALTMAVSGALGPYAACSLAVSGVCPDTQNGGSSTFVAGTSSFPGITAGNYNTSIGCTGTGPGQGTVAVSLSCVCP